MKGLKALNDSERETIFECLKFISDGKLFEMEADCWIRIGISVEEFHNVISEWPDVIDDAGTNAFLAINNSLVYVSDICSDSDSPVGQDWSKYFSIPPEEIEAVFEKWTASLE